MISNYTQAGAYSVSGRHKIDLEPSQVMSTLAEHPVELFGSSQQRSAKYPNLGRDISQLKAVFENGRVLVENGEVVVDG